MMNAKQTAMIDNLTAKQVERMKSNPGFMRFLHILMEKNGNFSTADISSCGMSFERFLRYSRFSSQTLYETAEALLERLEG